MGARHGTCIRMELSAATTTTAARQAFGDLLQRHRGIVLKVAGSYAADPEDRADLAQDIAAQLWRAWPSYAPDRPVTTWMYRIALNVAISHLRGRSLRDRHHVPFDETLHASAAHGATIEDDHEAGQQLRLLERVIAALPPLDRALMLLYLDERSQREIADVLGISESNVSTKLSRLKQRIRDEF
jgi:RNA polymerase sigma-70 factor (ECF subfamily)